MSVPELERPEVLRRALLHVADDVLPLELVARAGSWLYAQRGALERTDSPAAFAYTLPPAAVSALPGLAEIQGAVFRHVQEGAHACQIAPFDATGTRVWASFLHHGGFGDWSRVHSAPGERPCVAWTLFLSALPVMFQGGALEFLDGTAVEPRGNRLVVAHPEQATRVAPVECWSAEAAHGRWALHGLIDGEPASE